MSTSWTPPPDPTLHAPRILCLHGGGTTAQVFRAQCRSLIHHLEPHFRLVFADGPFTCPPHAAIIPVYQGMGPYRRWMRWAPSQAAVDDDVVIEKIETQMRGAMEADAKLGADGEWVGLLGFSQGAKVAASVLYESQLRGQEAGEGMYAGWDGEEEGSVEGLAGGKWRFGVFMAGSPPLVSMRGRERARGTMPRPGELTDNSWTDVQESMYRLRLPTVHVHGLRDGGLPVHRQLMNVYCEKGTTALVEWDGDHRVPIKSSDVKPVIDAIFNAAREAGIPTHLP